jgi:hypothetical protein
MFYTKKIVTLSLLLAGVVGTSFGSGAPKPAAWTGIVNPMVKKAGVQTFTTRESLVKVCRSTYTDMGNLRPDQVDSVRIFADKPDMTPRDALKFILATHPASPELRKSPSRVSPSAALTPRDVVAMSPLTLTGPK